MKKAFLGLFFAVFVCLAFLSATLPAMAVVETRVTVDTGGALWNSSLYSSISGDKVVWSEAGRSIWMYNVTTQIKTEIAGVYGSISRYCPSISGDKIVWYDNRNGANFYDVFVYDLITQAETQITNSNAFNSGAKISGDKIVWLSYFSGKFDVYLYDLGTQIEKRITTSGTADKPAISGDRIVWTDYRNGGDNGHIYMYDLIHDIESQISTGPSQQSEPVISGDKIAWIDGDWRYPGFSSVYMYDVTNQSKKNIVTNSAFGDSGYDLAISESKIVWIDYRNCIGGRYGNEDVYMYDMATQIETQITTDSANQMFPAISGDRIVWSDARNGGWDIYMYNLYVPPVNIPPVANIAAVPITILGSVTTFDGSESSDVDGTITSYHWDFGDGANTEGEFVDHVYALAGVYQATLTVTDNTGATATADATVIVDAPPIAVISLIQSVIFGEAATFNGAASHDSDGIIVSYQWNFGDGSTGTGAVATHAYASSGTYQTILTVTDNVGATATATTTVVVKSNVQAISDLISVVQGMKLHRGITSSLIKKLQNTIEALNEHGSMNRHESINKLRAFINFIQAQSGNKLTVNQANQLIVAANRIIAVLQ